MNQALLRHSAVAVLIVPLCACGGGGDDTIVDRGTGSTTWTAGTFRPSDQFAGRCATPRSGIDPETGRPYPDVAGSRTHENHWLRSWTNELYLWYREVPDLNPASYSTPDYFERMKTPATTSSGRP